MVYKYYLATRASLLTRRSRPSFGYVLHDRNSNSPDEDLSQQNGNNFIRPRYFGSNSSGPACFGTVFEDRKCRQFSLPLGIGSSFCRNMSTIGEGSEKMEIMTDVAGVLTDPSVQAIVSSAPAVNEVAIAAADSFFPVAALQYFIEFLHTSTGFNWWASIIVATLIIRGATVPLLINQLKATAKLSIIRPRMEEIQQEMQNKGMMEGKRKMDALFKEAGVGPFTPLKGLFIQGPVFISFFLAISNMAEKVPSFKVGGAYWFTDLTTPDDMYILQVLTALAFLITVECNMQEGMEGNTAAKTMKNVSRVLAVLTVPFTMSFPKAIFCYWLTSNFFSLAYGLVIKRPGVKKYLGIPEIPMAPPTTKPQTPFSLFPALKRAAAMAREAAAEAAVEPSKPVERISSSSTVVSQKLKRLEKEVKGRKKNKKRGAKS